MATWLVSHVGMFFFRCISRKGHIVMLLSAYGDKYAF